MAEKKDGYNSVVTTIVFILMFVFIGIPVWWKTTEIYRFPIPHEDCKQLIAEQVQHTIPAKLIIDDITVGQSEIWEYLLQNSEVNVDDSSKPFISFRWSMTSVSEEEKYLIQHASNISDLDFAFSEISKLDTLWEANEIKILILNQNFSLDPKLVIGRHTFGYVLNTKDSVDLASDVLILAKKMAQVSHLQKFFVPSSDYTMDKKPDKNRMRAVRSLVDFDITFSLFVSQPHVFPIQWNIKKAINAHFAPIVQNLSEVYNISVKSQILYMTPLPLPKKMNINEDEEYIVPIDILSSIINPAEARLGSDISVHQNLNFVIYVPTPQQSPSQIYDDQGKRVQNNAFLVPQWGGFVLWNCPLQQDCSFNDQYIMQIFSNQLRLLLGLPDISEVEDEKCQVLKNSFISQWELDLLVRKSVQDYLGTSTRSLASLSQLLHSIGNIVIRDEVGQQIESAVRSCHRSFDLLKEGHLREALREAREAFRVSESVFFDPSLLALLYFPEDQKYAIYIPLFLPVSIPVLSSAFRLWKAKRG